MGALWVGISVGNPDVEGNSDIWQRDSPRQKRDGAAYIQAATRKDCDIKLEGV